ncbi:MAG: GNAT family N-acetyltransferase [Patescibacteria group bacterium]
MNKIEILLIENRKTVRNKKAIKRVQEILRAQFPGLENEFIDNLPINIFGGTKMGFRYRLFISQNIEKEINGFIIYSHFPSYNFYFLDNMAAGPGLTNQGIGSELYQFFRQEAKKNDALGIFFECKSDEPDSGFSGEELKQNILRLKFYERFGARPIDNNQFYLKVNESGNSTLLVFDPLDIPITLTRDLVRKIAKKIILKKYSDFCPPDYIKTVVMSFRDNPIKIREPRYFKNKPSRQ